MNDPVLVIISIIIGWTLNELSRHILSKHETQKKIDKIYKRKETK